MDTVCMQFTSSRDLKFGEHTRTPVVEMTTATDVSVAPVWLTFVVNPTYLPVPCHRLLDILPDVCLCGWWWNPDATLLIWLKTSDPIL